LLLVRLTRLKDVRQRKALTQQQLAERAGVNRVTIARLEGGKDEPFPTTIRKVADALDVAPEDLMDRLPFSAAAPAAVLDDRLAVTEEEDVDRFLRDHPELAAVVREAADQLVRFIPDARLGLELLSDPEYGDEQLFLGVSTNMKDEEALSALRRFDQGWWVHHVRRAHGLLCIDLSYQ